MKRPAIAIMLVLVAAATVVVLIGRDRAGSGQAAQSASSPGLSGPAPSAEAGPGEVMAVAPTPAVADRDWPQIAAIRSGQPVDPAAWPALPEESARLDQIYDTLKTRADAGDHLAACRLALELHACADAVGHLRFQEQQARRQGELDPDVAAELLQSMEAALARTEGCGGHADLEALAWRYGRQAARAGNVAAMEAYAQDASRLVLDSTLPTAELKRILAERDTMLVTAFLAGSEAARRALLMSFGPHAGLPADAPATLDAVTREQVRYLLGELRDDAEGGTPGVRFKGVNLLTDDERRVADAALARLRPQWLAARTTRGANPQEEGANVRCQRGFGVAPDVSQPVDWRRVLALQP